MNGEIALSTYAAALLMSGAVQTVAPGDPNLFWPSFIGAGIAALRTVLPAFQKKSAEPPSAVAIRAFISLTAGFSIAFYGTEFFFSALAESARPPLPLGALLISAAGELFLSMATQRFQKTIGVAGKEGGA